MKMKKLIKAVALAVCLTMAAPVVAPSIGIETVEAATKLSCTKKTIYEKETFTLKITGTSKKVKWSSSNKKVATVTDSGKVKGIKEGNADITATVGDKKYICKVTVKKAESLSDEKTCALGIILLKYQLLNPSSLNVKSITAGTRDFDGEKLKVYWVSYTAQNRAGGYASGLDQIIIRNGKPSDRTEGYKYSDFFNCLTYKKLTNKFITDGDWSSNSIPSDTKNKKRLKVSTVLSYVDDFESEDKYTITD